jgi:hypothetical protein
VYIYAKLKLLSLVYEQKQAVGDQEAQTFIKDVSPVAW